MKTLAPKVDFYHSISLIVGSVLGSGLVILPGLVYQKVGAISLYSWVVMSVIIIPFVYIITKVSRNHPSAGGVITFINERCGKSFGVPINYMIMVSMIFLVPVVSIIASNYLSFFGEFSFNEKLLIAFSLLTTSTLLNIYRINHLLKMQGVGAMLLFVLLLVLIVTSFGQSYERTLFELKYKSTHIDSLWTGMTIIFWAYLGWENLSFLTEEFIDIKRFLIPASIASYLIMVFLYVGLSIAVIGLLDQHDQFTSIAPLAELSLLVFGKFGGISVTTIICLIMALNVNAWVWGPSRLVYAAGRQGVLFKALGHTNDKGVPANSLLFLLFCYFIVFLFMYIYKSCNMDMLIVQINANFILLYILTVFSFIKFYRGVIDRGVGWISIWLMSYFFIEFGKYAIMSVSMYLLLFLLNKLSCQTGKYEQYKTN
jgi:amino acid efflux transporter